MAGLCRESVSFAPTWKSRPGACWGYRCASAASRARSEGLIPSFELQRRGAAGPAGARGAAAAAGIGRAVAAVAVEPGFRAALHRAAANSTSGAPRTAASSWPGLDFSRSSDGGGRAADWFFRQTEFVVRNGTVRWTDEMRARAAAGAGPGGLRDAQQRAPPRVAAGRHAAAGVGRAVQRCAACFASRCSRCITAAGRNGTGQVHADFSRVDVSQLRRYANFGVEISEGHGAVRAWADIDHGQLTGGVADMVLADVSATLGPRAAAAGAAVRSRAASAASVWTAASNSKRSGLQFETREGQRWPGGNVFVCWTRADGGRLRAGESRAPTGLTSSRSSQIAARLPLGCGHSRRAGRLRPEGTGRNACTPNGKVRWMRCKNTRRAAARCDWKSRRDRRGGRERAARAGTPGVRGASVDFELTQAGGKGKVRVQQGRGGRSRASSKSR